MKHSNHSILNKKYSPAEYEKLAAKIVEQMKNEKCYGEFFPIKYSPFSYHETTTSEYFPLTKEKVLDQNWPWIDEKEPDYSNVTRDISKIPDEILNWALECKESHRLFKIQETELKFYRTMILPIPLYHPDVRHFHRLALRRPRKLHDRTCDKCHTKITSSHPTGVTERVYCEKCYLEAIY